MKKWFYDACGWDFHGFHHMLEEDACDFSATGNLSTPFETFSECKQDAVEHMQMGVREYQDSLRQIRSTKKKDVRV